jgi:Tfp pilus assembly ATPase PilU
MLTLEQSLSELVAAGLIEYEEAISHSLFPNEIAKPAAGAPVA